MTARNDVTGDNIKTGANNSQAYKDNWDRIFGKKDSEEEKEELTDEEE